MAPTSQALYNLREIAKLMILLEEYLSKKECNECVKRTFLLMETLAEEIMASNSKWTDTATGLALLVRRWQFSYIEGGNIDLLVERIVMRRVVLVEMVF